MYLNKVQQKKLLIVISSILFVILCAVIFLVLAQPSRSVANFCRVAKEEKSNFKANTSYDTLLRSFRKLDAVAPNEVYSDTTLIVKGYETITSDPSKAVATEFGIAGSQTRVNDYITKNCPDF